MQRPSLVPLFVASGAFVLVGLAQLAGWVALVAWGRSAARWDDWWMRLGTAAAYAGIGLLFFLGARRQRARYWRAAQGRCLACGYLLIGNVSGVCPECGVAVQPGARARR